MTRLVFVINDLARAGAEGQLVELATALDPTEWAIEIVLLKERNDFAERLSATGIRVTALRRSGFWDIGVLWRLFRRLRAIRPQIVHSYLFLSNLATALAGRWAHVPRIVLSQRCSYDATLNPVLRQVARWSHRRADRVIVNSAAALREEERGGAEPGSLVYIPNGVAIPPRAPRPDRASLGLPTGPLVLSVGQLRPVKGHRHLVEAWPRVQAAHPGARLVLIGDGPEQLALESACRRLDIGKSVVFLGFRAPTAPYIAACDVFVQPSLTEGMPNAVLEAMAHGRPIVATRVGGTPELLEDGSTGLLVPPRDPDALSVALRRLLASADLGSALGSAARKAAEERLSSETLVKRTTALYRALLASR